MLCYRDRCFCTAACAVEDCDRKLTDEVRECARRWWRWIAPNDGGDPAMSMIDLSDQCPDYTPVAA